MNHDSLKNPTAVDCIRHHSTYSQSDWDKFLRLIEFNSGTPASYIRTGTNILPVKNDIITALGWQIPVYDSTFSKSFSDISDQRCQQLKTKAQGKPWLVLWSGGIDSTVIVTSILKNFAPHELSQVKIGCNKISVYENPHFFYKYIKPNFELINSANLDFNDELFKTHIVIDGEPADQLFVSRAQDYLFKYPESMTKNVRNEPDQLLECLAEGTFDSLAPLGSKWATWFYETMMVNIDSVDVPIENYHDFYWWYMFNVTWVGIKIRSLSCQTDNTQESLQAYLDNFIHWFDTDDYQQWSMNNNTIGIKYGNNIADYKLVAKQYIYEFDRNEWYFKFKTKKNSGSRILKHPTWDCILDDFTRLNWKDHTQEILDLLPGHLV